MKIALVGYGKMGRTIEKLAQQAGDQIILKIGRDNYADFNMENLEKADVAIEFSTPEAAFDNIRGCLEAGVPVVSGTTAWLDRFDEVLQIQKKNNGAFFYASNFSIGVNILFAVNRYLAGLMEQQPDYNVSITEVHHIHKLDAPSGTAISLAKDLIHSLPVKQRWVAGATNHPEEIPVFSRRENEVPGTHQVTYGSPIDTLEISHVAHTREGFAAGALMAARWIQDKKGYFEMKDLLGF